MKKKLKITLLSATALITLLLGGYNYIKYSTRQYISEKMMNELIAKINSTPELPEAFKKTYDKLYPGIFDDNYNRLFLKSLFQKHVEIPPSKRLADKLDSYLGSRETTIGSKLRYLGLIWVLEDNTTQEKCFEYDMSYYYFGLNSQGIFNASLNFYNKTLAHLTTDEQLGLILLIKNPVYYNKFRFPDHYKKGVANLRAGMEI